VSIVTSVKKLLSVLASTVGVALAASSPALSVTLLSTADRLVDQDNGQIGTIDTSTGVFTPLLITPGREFRDIALSETQELLGFEITRLFSIDLDESTVTSLVQVGPQLLLLYSDPVGLNALGFDNNGELFGTGLLGRFYNIPTSTDIFTDGILNNDITLVSNLAPEFGSAGDIVFNPETNEFLAASFVPENSTLFSISLDGTATEIGSIGFANVSGLLFDNGTLFGYTQDGQQIVIDIETGAGTFDREVTGLNDQQIFGAASLPSSGPVRVPEPASVLGLLVLGAVGAGSVLKRNQQRSI
jgi:hypothetical protein